MSQKHPQRIRITFSDNYEAIDRSSGISNWSNLFVALTYSIAVQVLTTFIHVIHMFPIPSAIFNCLISVNVVRFEQYIGM